MLETLAGSKRFEEREFHVLYFVFTKYEKKL